MTARSRILIAPTTPPTSPPIHALNSDFVVILTVLTCALICVIGLLALASCSCFRRPSFPKPANKGLKKKVLNSLPKFTYGDKHEHIVKLSDGCAICLSEFVVGEEVRVLPQCGHGFHVGCVDAWLVSHSSCPSCRTNVAGKCEKCGVFGASRGKNCSTIRPVERESYVHTFLP